MAFIVVAGSVVSYSEAVDVKDKDQRVFEANEINYTDVPDSPGSLDAYLEDLLIKSTSRINEKIRASAQWRIYLGYTGIDYDVNNIPQFNPNRILSRKADFTDMCCYYVLKEYILPKVADFGNPESPEVQKIQYYERKFTDLFEELLSMMDWYDSDGDGTVEDSERMLNYKLPRRTRGRRRVASVR